MQNLSAAGIKTLVDRLLEKRYNDAALSVIKSVRGQLGRGKMATRLKQLQDEMQRLKDANEPLKEDNPVLRAYFGDLGETLKRTSGYIDGASLKLEEGAIDAAGKITKQLALPGFIPEEIRSKWNDPNPDAIRRVVDYTQSDAWKKRLDEFAPGINDRLQKSAIKMIIEGKNPLEIGRFIAGMTEKLTLAQAQTMMRTLQLTSYRDAAVVHGLENADILSGQIRIAVLDKRTCLSCIALHGTPLKIGERVNDHENGRCTSIYIVKGRPTNIQTGEQWFAKQTPLVQEEMMGPAGFKAFQAGDLKLSDYPRTYNDEVYGDMIREATLKEMLGPKAAKYMKRN